MYIVLSCGHMWLYVISRAQWSVARHIKSSRLACFKSNSHKRQTAVSLSTAPAAVQPRDVTHITDFSFYSGDRIWVVILTLKMQIKDKVSTQPDYKSPHKNTSVFLKLLKQYCRLVFIQNGENTLCIYSFLAVSPLFFPGIMRWAEYGIIMIYKSQCYP